MMKNNKSLIKTIISALLCLLMTATGLEANTGAEAEERIRFIQKRLDAGTKNAKRWQYSWSALYGASTLYNGVSALDTISREDKKEEEKHFDHKVNGIKSGLAFGKMIFNPLTAYSAAEKLRKMPERSFEQQLKKMRAAEKLLKRSAEREKAGRSWKEHAMAVTVNLLAGLAIAKDGDRKSDAAISVATGIIASEIQIFTMPTKAIKDWNEYYRLFYFDEKISLKDREKERRFFVSAIPHGLKYTYLF